MPKAGAYPKALLIGSHGESPCVSRKWVSKKWSLIQSFCEWATLSLPWVVGMMDNSVPLQWRHLCSSQSWQSWIIVPQLQIYSNPFISHGESKALWGKVIFLPVATKNVTEARSLVSSANLNYIFQPSLYIKDHTQSKKPSCLHDWRICHWQTGGWTVMVSGNSSNSWPRRLSSICFSLELWHMQSLIPLQEAAGPSLGLAKF